MAATAAAADAVTITPGAAELNADQSEDSLRWYDRTEQVQYGFCGNCGSTLFWRVKDKPGHLSITAGSLDQPTGLRTTLALFGDHAADYHDLDMTIETVGQDRQLGVSDD